MKRLLFIFSFSILTITSTLAHQRAKFDIVIDTDCGKDDFRALTYFLASRDFNINAIITTGGVIEAETASKYISYLLKSTHHEGIPIEIGSNATDFKQNCYIASNFWKTDSAYNTNINTTFNAICNNEKQTIYIALGPLSSFAKLLDQQPNIAQKIAYIAWYADYDNLHNSFNYSIDSCAYKKVISHNIKIKHIASADSFYNNDFSHILSQINTVYANEFANYNLNTDFSTTKFKDDITPFYIFHPELFSENFLSPTISCVVPKQSADFSFLASTILNSTETEKGVIFTQLPTNGIWIASDVRAIADNVIKKHGYTEYKLILLASEMHSHLGIYSIIGVKMGLRVLEYLHVGLDELEIESYAGNKPPISCLNDGLQLGAGTTLGYGAISIIGNEKPCPQILVNYNGRKLLFELKENYRTEIAQDVELLVTKYGLESEVYWSEIRRLSIEKYWQQWSRNEIFEIKDVVK